MLKKILLVVGALILLVALAVGGGLAYLVTSFPRVSPAEELKVATSPELVARGRYLAHNVAVCLDCHSARDWEKFSGPLVPGSLGKGGEYFGRDFGFPGDFYARNVTPAGIGDWTDGEVLRAFTAGVGRDGRPFFPVMPYPSYAAMTRADAEAIVAYLRTLAPIEHAVPDSAPAFPMNLVLRTLPKDAAFGPEPDATDSVARGRYLTTIGACADCHTPKDHGAPIPGKVLAGGFEFRMPIGTVRSANLTPDPETGIGSWTRAQFVKRFKDMDPQAGYAPPAVDAGAFNTVMPWTMYAGMTPEDLGAIYDYLRSLPPVKHPVERFTPKAGD